MATILMIFLRINCPNVIGLIRRRHTKFQIGMAAAIPAIPLPAPLVLTLRGAWTQLHKLGDDIRRSFLDKKFVSAFGYFAAYSNAGGSNLSYVENDAKFGLFDPL